MTFRCVYCAEDHPDAARAVEHIIPELLGNRSYVHRNTCARINQGLARAVEAPFQKKSTIESILFMLAPPRGNDPKFFATLPTERGTEENAYMHRGKLVLADKPDDEHANEIPVTLTRRDRTETVYTLRLPFEVLRRTAGSELLLTPAKIARREREIEANRVELDAYVRRLRADPTIDPDFLRFVQENDIVLHEPTLRVTAHHSRTPNTPVADLLPREHVLNFELMARYFIKIAILFAAETSGWALLTNPVSATLRSYVTAFFVDPDTALGDDGARLPFFSEGVVDGERSFWWTDTAAQSETAINTDTTILPHQRAKLLLANAVRMQQVVSIQPFVNPRKLGDVGLPFHSSPSAYAWHELRTRHVAAADGTRGTWCDVQLFGGLFDVQVQLSADSNLGVSEMHKRIETPWYGTGK